MQKTYTSAVIGLGRIAFTLGYDKKREQPASHTMALKANRRIKIIAGCDIDEDRLEKWQKANPGAKTYSSSHQLYEENNPDIVTVAVNENAHMEKALEAIRAKPKLVILEKPVALNTQEAEKIRVESEKHGVPVLVNHERRFAVDYNLAKSLMSEIGDIQTVRAELTSGLCVYNPEAESTGAYSLIHDGTHLVDVVMFFLGEKISNPVVTGIFRDEKNCVRQLSAHYETQKCPDVTVSISGRSRFFGFEVVITGTEGRICVGNGIFKFYRRKESRLYSRFYSLTSDKKIRKPKKTLYFANMVQNAVDYLDGICDLKSTLQTGTDALVVLEEIKSKL